MIDWHTHILPCIDDGSKSIKESIAMLRLLRAQGVRTVIATPHFYADADSVEAFLKKRERSFEALSARLGKGAPRIIPGAEVCYYPGISNLEGLERLCIQGTDLLLLEMPMAKWTEPTLKEVVELSCSGGFTVIIAHIDRYMGLQDEAVIRKMSEAGILMQINASCFQGFFDRRKAFRLLSSGIVRFIGSDCHNTGSRKPMIGEAFIHIRKKFGDDFVRHLNKYGYSMIN